jgi:RNA polymerase sigma-70 factor (ECF subfamily)
MLGNHSDADDVVQETFIQVHRSVHKFRKDAQFSTWLFTISGRKALDWIRKNERHRSTSLDEVFALRDSDLATDVLYGGDEIERRLDAAVLSLPPKQRQVFTLRYFQKMKYQEMSKITGTSEGALKASYYHAVRKIKKHVALESVGL